MLLSFELRLAFFNSSICGVTLMYIPINIESFPVYLSRVSARHGVMKKQNVLLIVVIDQW
tara:strand:- start:103 stop:282 length:180 start_codon:yes stop_codon:yes gene_type:complete